MALVPSQPLRLPALAAYRAATAKRRAAAFCDAPEYVQGVEVLPLTPATVSMLVAINSPFMSPGAPVRESDVRNYLWFHSRLYGHCGVPDWRRRKRRALRGLNAKLAPWWARLLGMRPHAARYYTELAIAGSEIQQLVTDAFADSPPASGRPGKPLATLEAFFIHIFAQAYHWEPERTRHTPLRQLIQLHRCIRSAQGEEVADDGEDKILAEHLRARNAEAAEARRANNG